MGRKPLPGQLDLGLWPEEQGATGVATPRRGVATPAPKREARPAAPAPLATANTAVVIPVAMVGPLDFIPHAEATREERIMLALRRDLATLAGPPEYVCDRAFYESRVAGYRAMLSV